MNSSREPAEGEQEGRPQKPLLFVGRVLRTRTVVRGKGVGRGGRQTHRTSKSKSDKEIQDNQSKKYKIIEVVIVSGQDAPAHYSQVLRDAQVKVRALKSWGCQTGSGAARQASARGGQ